MHFFSRENIDIGLHVFQRVPEELGSSPNPALDA